MSPTPPALPAQPWRSPRVLACVLCQQRKVKCDRRFPCAHCVKSRVQCIPSTLAPRRRKQRFPERELLERLRKYEDLLRQNDIKFEPLHKDSTGDKETPKAGIVDNSDDEQHESVRVESLSPSATIKSEKLNFWTAMNQGFRDPDDDSDSSQEDIHETLVKKAWEQFIENKDHLLFGSRMTNVDLATLHPDPIQIFRLWQIYLDNVNPLLKVTHTPTLQGRIIEGASNVAKINPTLEALMFGIYSMAILSLVEEECQTIFNSPKEDLLARYQFGCQQALSNCEFLRSSDRDCLTALYLCLISIRSNTAPQTLSSMLGAAVRIGQRMGIHNESSLAKCNVLEAEMRRRLWWSLLLFDTRISEMADYKTETLAPTWDCQIPLNVNDSELRPEMKEPPIAQGIPTEAIFAVIRGELGDFIRNTAFHLDFTNPALKPLARDIHGGPSPEGGELVTLEKLLNEKYFKLCSLDNPLHFITIWLTRGHLAKLHLVEHYSRYSKTTVHQTEAQRDVAISYALDMLECDSKIIASPFTKRYYWLLHFHFPFTAYIHILQDLRKRPIRGHAERAWEIMSQNLDLHSFDLRKTESSFFNIFVKLVLHAWEAREAAFGQLGQPLMPPKIVSTIRNRLAQTAESAQNTDIQTSSNVVVNMGMYDFPMSMPMTFASHNLYGMEMQEGFAETGSGINPKMIGDTPLDMDVNQLDWGVMDMGLSEGPSW